MKAIPFLVLAAVAILPAHADVPNKVPLVKYTGLWTNSPFTSKPEVIGPAPVANPLENYTLTGISPIPGGYRVTIVSKKNPDSKEVIASGETNASGFKIVSVNRNSGRALGTTVTLSSGSTQGTVSFEPELIALKAAPAAQQQAQQGSQNNPNLPPGINPNQIQNSAAQATGGDSGARAPRARIVPPTTPQGSGGNSTSGSGAKEKQTPIIRRR